MGRASHVTHLIVSMANLPVRVACLSLYIAQCVRLLHQSSHPLLQSSAYTLCSLSLSESVERVMAEKYVVICTVFLLRMDDE